MATHNLYHGTGAHLSRRSATAVPYVVENFIDWSEISAAASDVYNLFKVPAGTMVLGGGIEVVKAVSGTTTDLTAQLAVGSTNITGAADIDAASSDSYVACSLDLPTIFETESDGKVTLSAFTGTLTGGKLRVFLVLLDVSNKGKDRKLAPRGG